MEDSTRLGSVSIAQQGAEKARWLTWIASEAEWEEAGEAFVQDLANEGGKPSSTANMVAAVRATELTRVSKDRICHDPLAACFVGLKLRLLTKSRLITRLVLRVVEAVAPGLTGYVAGRTRYLDQYLQGCAEAGFRQIVFLGAGYDSRAYRLDLASPGMKVFEVDSPATQREKLYRAKKAFGRLPREVVYVAVDFDRDRLDTRMFESGYDRDVKTLFVWEGVTYYITPKAVDNVLRFVSGDSGPGSTILFDYLYRSFLDGTCRLRDARRLRIAYRLIWTKLLRLEPFVFGIEPGELNEFMSVRGFTVNARINGDHRLPGGSRKGVCFFENVEAMVPGPYPMDRVVSDGR